MKKSTAPGVYELSRPDNPLPLIFDSPHSGREYPADFGFECAAGILEKAEDRYVDRLFAHAPGDGAAFLCALFPRSYIDANRAEDDIDPQLLSSPWPGRIRPSQRSEAGIGLIRRLVSPDVPVYGRKLEPGEIARRIETFYRPYHETLGSLIGEAHAIFGQVWHVNCHSMPSRMKSPTRPHGHGQQARLPDFVIGDREGTTCEREFSQAVFSFLRKAGYKVAMNEPYRGVELVRRYSNPPLGRHSLQIEINRALYLDEAANEPGQGYEELAATIRNLTKFCAGYVASNLTQMAAD